MGFENESVGTGEGGEGGGGGGGGGIGGGAGGAGGTGTGGGAGGGAGGGGGRGGGRGGAGGGGDVARRVTQKDAVARPACAHETVAVQRPGFAVRPTRQRQRTRLRLARFVTRRRVAPVVRTTREQRELDGTTTAVTRTRPPGATLFVIVAMRTVVERSAVVGAPRAGDTSSAATMQPAAPTTAALNVRFACMTPQCRRNLLRWRYRGILRGDAVDSPSRTARSDRREEPVPMGGARSATPRSGPARRDPRRPRP